MITLTQRIKAKTGAVVMPVLRTPDDVWIQDTSEIIDAMERRFPDRPILPDTPIQRFVSYLIEAWGDEWWIPIAMHTRWSYPENYPTFEREAGQSLLPGAPGFAQKRAAAQVANSLRAMLPAVGVRPEHFAVMNEWTERMLDLIDAHFAAQPYLLGTRPTLADFGLVGTMYAHLGRDPWPARELIAPRTHLRDWIERMNGPPEHEDGALLANDAIAPTLEPIIVSIFAEFTPMLEGVCREVRAVMANVSPGEAFKRVLGDVEMPMGEGRFTRAALPFTLWMAQRVLDVYRAMPAEDQRKVAAWVEERGGFAFLALDIPRLKRVALRVALA
jgi:glutathione S-transferase